MEPELITSMTSQREVPLSSQQGVPLQDLEAESPAPPPYLAPPPYPDPADMIGLAGCDIPPQGPPLYLTSCNITHMAPPPCDVTFLAPPPAPPLHMEEQEAPLDLSMSSQDRVTDEALDLSRRTCRSSTHRAPSVWTMPAAPDLGSKPMSLSVPDPGSLPVPVVGGGPLEGFLSRLCCQHQRLLLGLLRYATNSRTAIAAAGSGPAVVRQTIGTAEEPGPVAGSSREPTAGLVMAPALSWGPSGLTGLAGPTCDGSATVQLCEEDTGARATALFSVNGGGAVPIHFQTPGQPLWLPVQAVQPLRVQQSDAGGASEAGARPVDPLPVPSSFPGVDEAEEREGVAAASVVEGPATTEDGAVGSTAPGKHSPKKRKKKSKRRKAAVTVAGAGAEARAGGLGRSAGTARKSLVPGCARATTLMPHLLQQQQQRHRRRHHHHHRRCGYERPSLSEAAQCDVVYVSRPVDPHGDGAGESVENAAGSGNDGGDGNDGATAAAPTDAGVSVATPVPKPLPAPPLSPVRCYGKRSARKSTRGHVSGAGGTWEVHTVRVARAALIGVPDIGRRRALSDNNSRSLPNNTGAGTGTSSHHHRRTLSASCCDASALFPATGERHSALSENELGGGGGGEILKTVVPPVPVGPSEDNVVRVEDGARIAQPRPRVERGVRARMRSWRGLRTGAGAATNARKTARGSGLVGASAEIAASPSALAPPTSSCQMAPPERLATAPVVAGPSMPAAEPTATDGDGVSLSLLDRVAPPTPPPPAAASLTPTAETGEPSHLPSTDLLAGANRSPIPPASPALVAEEETEESAPLVRAGTEMKREEEERRGGDAALPSTPEAAPSSSPGVGAGEGGACGEAGGGGGRGGAERLPSGPL
uniref:Uncharacterized protein LOC116944362 n=1 Tax=Petromyzon marinus TaxID=7757 RepID=A0AAJ7TBU8_PETMA|nr:uncharacterized protein LOC116944362 [Petromyzon marinus]